jgi:tetrapyrrole methylase family protein/MazG family protein
MAKIKIVGLGPGPLSLLTKEAECELLHADKIFFRTASLPAYDWLRGLGKKVASFDRVYCFSWPSALDMYGFMVTALLKEAALRGGAIYALPGSPSVLEDTTRMLMIRGKEAGVDVEIVQGVSFIEPALAAINFDFSMGLQIILPRFHVRSGRFSKRLAMLVCQVDSQQVDHIARWLLKTYPPEHLVTMIWTVGMPSYEMEHKPVALADLAREFGEGKYFASLLVPPVGGDGAR